MAAGEGEYDSAYPGRAHPERLDLGRMATISSFTETQRRRGAVTRRTWCAVLALCTAALMATVSWSPGLADQQSQLHLSAAQVAELGTDTAPATIGPVTDLVDDASGVTMYQRNAYHRHAIGSITKLMTALLTVHRLNLNKVVTVSHQAASTPGSTMGLVAGDRLTVRSLLYGLLIPSGNDAAEELAETMAGDDKGFALLANHQAKLYHLECSHYVTPHGLDAPHQYSCAADVAALTRIVLRTRLLAHIVQTRSIVIHGACCGEAFPLVNTDLLLGNYPGAIGVKTGTTDEAGGALSGAARQDGHTLIAVVLGSTEYGRFPDAESLLNFGFGDFVWPNSIDTMWSTASLEHRTIHSTPIPKWEEPWMSVSSNGQTVAPRDDH